MTISLDDVIAELSAENRAKVEEGAKRIYDECLTLPEQGQAKQMIQRELSLRPNKP